MMIDSDATASPKSANRPDHAASRDFGSSPKVGLRAIQYTV